MPLLDLFWTMLIIFLWIIYIWLLITIFIDLFRSDMSGFAKAIWVIVLILFTFIVQAVSYEFRRKQWNIYGGLVYE